MITPYSAAAGGRREKCLRYSLTLLLVLAAPFSLYFLVIGASLAPFLLRAERPFAVAAWLAVLVLPVWLWFVLRVPPRSPRFYPLAIASWLYTAGVAYSVTLVGREDLWAW